MTPLRVLPNVEPYWEATHEGVLQFASETHTAPEDTPLVLGICLRESWGGYAPGYKPKGSPDGAGDWTARVGHWTKRLGVAVYADNPINRDVLLALGFSLPKKDTGEIKPGPYAIPADRLGWGRGLFQADILGDHRDLIMRALWPVDRQAMTACAQLHLARQQLTPWADHFLHGAAVVARYNTTLDNVRAGLEAGNPDLATTGGDYSRDVFALRDALRARYPTRFPRLEATG